jgi:hypothetical protein
MMISVSPSAQSVCADKVVMPNKVTAKIANALKRVAFLENKVIKFMETGLQVSITSMFLQITKVLVGF